MSVSGLRAIRGEVAREDAQSVARSVFGPAARVERELFYPYYWFLLRGSWRTVLGPSRVRTACLVDARTRLVSTTDAFETELVDTEPTEVLGPRMAEPDAEVLARRAAESRARRAHRAFAAISWELVASAVVHKRFFVATAPGDRGERLLLVDGVTGAVCPLAG